jgi:large subunit ribosomal protein L10
MTTHTKKWKQNQLEMLVKLIDSYPVIAVADINMFPSNLFQQIRKKLTMQGAIVKVSNTNVIRKALELSKNGKGLVPYAKSNCALVFASMNPFELFSFVKKNKGKIAAKEGAIAEEDIVIPAGDTGLPPGPALSDLKGAGLKVAVQGSTISVMEDKVVTKAGEKVTAPVAATLMKLNIKPFKVGLKFSVIQENGQIYTAEILDIDTEKVFANFMNAHRNAMNLAINASITNSATIELLIVKAFKETKAIAIEGNIITPMTAADILAKADRQAKSLKSLIKEGLS